MIAIIDYGMGNIHSVNKALQYCGAKTLVTSKPEDIRNSDKIVLPGVGAFADAMKELESRGITSVLRAEIKKKPFLGICLGMQLLFEKSEEAPGCKGLALLKGEIRKFVSKQGLKVPHMGWNQLSKVTSECPLLKDIPDKAFVYFCHSYYPKPEDARVSATTTDYGIDFTSCIRQDDIYGVQFHPEKSQSIGLKIVENFVKSC
jgi:imidazole glycerol-phosphate synthase subunit HisH